MHLTLQQLRLFEAVARLRSFTRAAAELYLTQPAISIQIKRLEEGVGLPLLEQVGKRIFLTAAGEEMYGAAQEVLERLKGLEGAMDDLHGKVKGPLRMAVATTAKYFMPHFLGAFLREHPEVEPSLKVTNRARVLERLAANLDDLTIMGRAPEGLEVEATAFLENPLLPVASPDHPLAGERNIPLERLAQERFLIRETGSGTRSALDRLLAEQGLEVRPYMELGSGEAIKQGVMAGLGVSVLSSHSIRLERSAGLLAVLDVEGFPLVRQWYCVHPKGKRLSNTARSFRDYLLEQGPSLL
jgi:LysR family transcriptional regulator, low CO2-responsive transcriptional regulator